MRTAQIERKTGETDIKLEVDLDGSEQWEIDTGVGFFDHMLSHISAHGLVDLRLQARGDLHVDAHHTVEDVGIALGSALRQALGLEESPVAGQDAGGSDRIQHHAEDQV